MNTLRTEDDYKRAIKEYVRQAEASLEADLAKRDRQHEDEQSELMSDSDLQHYMQAYRCEAVHSWCYPCYRTQHNDRCCACDLC